VHFLNPVPLQEIYNRWIRKFERTRLKALRDLKRRLEVRGNVLILGKKSIGNRPDTPTTRQRRVVDSRIAVTL
jgi:hypothetical protein